MLICGRCSAPIPPVAAFCPACGVRFVTPARVVTPPQVVTPVRFIIPARFVTPALRHTTSKVWNCFLVGVGLLGFLLGWLFICFLVLALVGLGNALSYAGSMP